MDWNSLIENCESDLRAAKVEQVTIRLREVKSGKVPRRFALPVANICRRSGLITLALRILAPILLPNRKNSNPVQMATPQETAEYAVCLQRFGAVREARDRLEGLDFEKVPEALLYSAFCDFNQWCYADAIPKLNKYLKSDLDPYSSLVGQTNLAAALVATMSLAEAEILVTRNILEAQRLGVRRLEGNNFELRAQIYLQQGEYVKLRDQLSRAEKLLKEEGGFESGFVEKWRAVAVALSQGSLESLKAYRALALSRHDWENVRDSDRFLIKAKFDSDLFNYLSCGSPSMNFRERLYADLKRKPESESYRLGPASGALLNIQAGTFQGKSILEVGQKPWQLLLLLSRDLYKPASIGELFSNLYSDEQFNVFSSPARIHQLLARLRGILRAESVPLEILEIEGSYMLKANDGIAVLLRLETQMKSTHEAQLEKILDCFPAGSEFSSHQAAEILEVPETTLRRFMRWGIESGHIKKFGAGYNTRYVVLAPAVMHFNSSKKAA